VPPQVAAAHADVIFTGSVLKISPRRHEGDSWFVRQYKRLTGQKDLIDWSFTELGVEFEVETLFRGEETKRITVWTAESGGMCGYPFELEGQYLVFAHGATFHELSTGLCSGTKLLENAAEDLEYLTGLLGKSANAAS